jgi:hypothetical protein
VSGSSTPPAAENAPTPPSRDTLAALGAPGERQELKLLLVAARHHLASPDLRNLLQFLKQEDCGFDVSLRIADPGVQP